MEIKEAPTNIVPVLFSKESNLFDADQRIRLLTMPFEPLSCVADTVPFWEFAMSAHRL